MILREIVGRRRWARKLTSTAFAFWMLPAVVWGRETWLEQGLLTPTKGEDLVIRLLTGDRLKTEEERPLLKDRVGRFDLYADRAAKRDLLAIGLDGQMPAAKVRLESGAALFVMDRKPRAANTGAAKFNQYLADEGLEAVAAQRAKLGQIEAPGREIHTRFLKALVQDRNPANVTPNTLYKRRVGQKLEMLLENDPGALGLDGRVVVKVVFDDHPLTGVKVFACRRNGDNQPPFVISAVTSAKGTVDLKLDQPGLWMLCCSHLRAVAPGAKVDAQWESFGSTYTFTARPAPPTPTPRPSPSASASVAHLPATPAPKPSP